MTADFNAFDGSPAKLAAYFEFCQSIENNIDRRYQTNRFNLSIITALLVALGYLLTSHSVNLPNEGIRISTAINIVWLVISITWFFQILRFREVSQIKYKIAADLELELGISIYRKEADALSRSSSIIEYTQIELMLPILSAIVAVIYFFWFSPLLPN